MGFNSAFKGLKIDAGCLCGVVINCHCQKMTLVDVMLKKTGHHLQLLVMNLYSNGQVHKLPDIVQSAQGI